MRHFVESEFGESWEHMSEVLLTKLDEFREQVGHSIIISPAPGALARFLGPTGKSQHNVDKWGECRAADIMSKHFETDDHMRRAYGIAKEIGFTGIGVSMIWSPHWGFHLDVRQGRQAGNPAKWAYTREEGQQRIVAVDAVFGETFIA